MLSKLADQSALSHEPGSPGATINDTIILVSCEVYNIQNGEQYHMIQDVFESE
jgi:hypothetical protein